MNVKILIFTAIPVLVACYLADPICHAQTSLSRKDPRVVRAEGLASTEVMKHLRNSSEVSLLSGDSTLQLWDDAPTLNRSVLIDERYMMLMRYYKKSNSGVKCYVDLVRNRAITIAYDLNCKYLLWRNIDRMLRDLIGLDAMADQSLELLLLDFLLPIDFQLYTSPEPDSFIRISRFFGQSMGGNQQHQTRGDHYYIWNPHMNIDVSETRYLVVKPKQKVRRERIRYYSLPHDLLMEDLSFGYGGAYRGFRGIYDFNRKVIRLYPSDIWQSQ